MKYKDKTRLGVENFRSSSSDLREELHLSSEDLPPTHPSPDLALLMPSNHEPPAQSY